MVISIQLMVELKNCLLHRSLVHLLYCQNIYIISQKDKTFNLKQIDHHKFIKKPTRYGWPTCITDWALG